MTVEWTEGEPGWRDFTADLRRLLRRNAAHPLPLLLLVLCTTLVGLAYGYRWQPTYDARIALRLTEHDVGVTVAPRPISELRAFVADVALSDRVLERIITRFNLYPQKHARGLDQALEALREDIDVEVWRNEFLVEDADDVGRSARVALRYSSRDPDVAWGVVEAMAEATIAEQRRVRRAQAEYLAMGLEPAILTIEERLNEVKARLSPNAPAPAAGDKALATARRLQLIADVEDLEGRHRELTEKRNEAQMRLRAETLNIGLRSDIIDSTRPERRSLHRAATILGALIGFLVGLLLGSVTVKAFDRRVYDEDDLRRLGLTLCGALPAFPGDGVGSMDSRVRMTKR